MVKLYDKWCELEKLKYKTYTLKLQTFPALTGNKEFRSIRNMIIKTVLKLHEPLIDDYDPVLPEPKESLKLSDLVNNMQGLYKYGMSLAMRITRKSVTRPQEVRQLQRSKEHQGQVKFSSTQKGTVASATVPHFFRKQKIHNFTHRLIYVTVGELRSIP